MKTEKLIIIVFLSLLAAGIKSYAVDYYPEMGTDPFYSSLNPDFVNEDDTIINILKRKKQKNDTKEQKIQDEDNEIKQEISVKNKFLNIFKHKNKEEENLSSIEEVKKPMTKRELEKALREEEREKQKEIEKAERADEPSLKEKFAEFSPFGKIRKQKNRNEEEAAEPDIELTADYMEYFPERFEASATGNAKAAFKRNDFSISADKIVFNYDRNILKAIGNVVLLSEGSVTEGDFVKIDLKNPDGWFENPLTATDDIKLYANEAFIYSDKIEEYDGVAKILKDDVLRFGAKSFAAYADHGHIFSSDYITDASDSKGIYKLKANTIIIDSKHDHEVINVKNADLYLKNVKIASIPSLKIVTNKQHIGAETNFPEFGSQSLLGMHAGPAVVLNVPGGSTLKLAPIVTYYKSKIGAGGIARFRNRYNMTEAAYGTSGDELLIRGRQKLAPGLVLNYSRLTNQNEWFLGYRKPKYSMQLTYSRTDYIEDLRLSFSQRFMAGAFVDNKSGYNMSDADWRFRWMTQTYKPLYSYANEEGNIEINAGLAVQTAASVYTTGDVFGLLRAGPAINTKVGPWHQSLMYYQSAIAGQSPFSFDRYRYGRSNFIFIESLKICKYLSVGYLASLAMNRDVRSDDLFQENRILISIGPDYAKFTLGYDSIRHNTMFLLSMVVGTQDSDVEFKKTIIKNPRTLGVQGRKKSEKFKRKSKKQYLKEIEENI